MMESTYLMKCLTTPNQVILPCSRLVTLISILPDATPIADTWFKALTLGA